MTEKKPEEMSVKSDSQGLRLAHEVWEKCVERKLSHLDAVEACVVVLMNVADKSNRRDQAILDVVGDMMMTARLNDLDRLLSLGGG